MFEWIRGEKRTPQDEFGRTVLQDYAAFLYTVPWYKYPFREKARRLDGDIGADAEQLRSWERDFALGAEYFVKIGYAALIQKALDAGGDDEPRDIMFVVAARSPQALAKEPRIKPIRRSTPNGSWCRRRATRHSPKSCRACSIRVLALRRSRASRQSSSR